MTYFVNFSVECIPEEIKKFVGNKNFITNTSRIQAYDSVMCGYFSIGFIGFMFKGKTLTDFTNLFSRHNFKKNNEVILNYFWNDFLSNKIISSWSKTSEHKTINCGILNKIDHQNMAKGFDRIINKLENARPNEVYNLLKILDDVIILLEM